jgi:hypothetical protein
VCRTCGTRLTTGYSPTENARIDLVISAHGVELDHEHDWEPGGIGYPDF